MLHLTTASRPALIGAGFVGAIALAAWMVRPFASASIGPDAAAPVIEFQRLVAGQQLEGYLSQTSKPFLTLVYGLLHDATGDWRVVAWSAIVAFAACVVLGGILAHRSAGPAAGAFAAIAFLLSPALLADLSLAYALPWALLSWLVAGLAVTARRPRYAVAGISLMAGSLARPETLAVIGVVAGALIAAEIVTRVGQRPGPPRAAYLVLLGLLAIPILAGHDWALFGDPLFWAKTAQVNSEGQNVRPPLAVIRFVVGHVLQMGPALPLAALGGAVLLVRRQWSLAIGLAGVTLGIAAFFTLAGIRGTALASRYLVPIDLGIVFAAGLGVAALDVPLIRWWANRWPLVRRQRAVASLLAGAIVAIAVAPAWPFDNDVRRAVRTQVELHSNAQRAMATINGVLGATPSWRGMPPSSGVDEQPLVIAPPRLRAQLVVDLDLPLRAVAKSLGSLVDLEAGRPAAGTIVYHDLLDDKPNPRLELLEVEAPTTVGSLRIVPLLADPTAGVWVIRVENATAP